MLAAQRVRSAPYVSTRCCRLEVGSQDSSDLWDPWIQQETLATGTHIRQSGGGTHREQPLYEMCSGSEAGSYLRLIDFCITHL